jgi:hypothetical protein
VNTKLLIEAIVRQTMVLIAQLATTAGRTPLSHVANQVFLDLVTELEAQGVRQKVVADMFGMALRAYQKKVQRLSESATFGGRSLWEAIHAFLGDKGVVSQTEILTRFRHDDDAMVRGVLRDLVATGLVFQTGRGHQAAYRMATHEDLDALEDGRRESKAALVWLEVYRNGPLRLSEIRDRLHLDTAELRGLLDDLILDGRVAEAVENEDTVFLSDRFVIPMESPVGWEAAMFDHYMALVSTLCVKLQSEPTGAARADEVGGSTYSFDVWRGHPHEEEARGLLTELRGRFAELRQRVVAYNSSHDKPDDFSRVIFYFGQVVKPPLWEAEAEGEGPNEPNNGGSNEGP